LASPFYFTTNPTPPLPSEPPPPPPPTHLFFLPLEAVNKYFTDTVFAAKNRQHKDSEETKIMIFIKLKKSLGFSLGTL
jgi:hypothetical protein